MADGAHEENPVLRGTLFTRYLTDEGFNMDRFRNADWLQDFGPGRVKWAGWQLERCPDTDRLHIQGGIIFATSVRFKRVREVIGNKPHLDFPIRSRPDYGMKERSRVEGPWEYGTRDARKHGEVRRELYAAVDEATTDRAFLDELDVHPTQALAYLRLRDRLAEPYEGPWLTMDFVYGPSGSGKTEYLKALSTRLGQRAFEFIPQDGKFSSIAPYRGEQIIYFNEFQNATLSDAAMAILLSLLDTPGARYMDWKGGSGACRARHILFLSQDRAPWELRFGNVGQRTAFLRRLAQFGKVIRASNPHGTRETCEYTPVPLSSAPPYLPTETHAASDDSPEPLLGPSLGADYHP